MYCRSVVPIKTIGAMEKLEKVQQHYTRFHFDYKTIGQLSYENRCKALSLPSLAIRFATYDLVMLNKLINNLLYLSVDPIEFNPNNRGHRNKLFKHRFNSSDREFYWINRTTDNYNSLPTNLLHCRNIHLLINHVKSLRI